MIFIHFKSLVLELDMIKREKELLLVEWINS